MTCWTSRSAICDTSAIGAAVILAMTVETGALIATWLSAWRISSAAGAISGQWNGAETFSGMALAPSSLAFSTAMSTAAFSPEMTIWPALLSLATTTTPAAEPALQASSARARSVLAPISTAIAPTPTGTARCMAWPRSLSRRAVSLSEKVPAAAWAEYSPSEWPATYVAWAQAMPKSFSSTRAAASDTAMMAGWAFSVRVSWSSGPSNIRADSFWPNAASTSAKTSRAVANWSNRSLPMPTLWLPWPGKTNASVMSHLFKNVAAGLAHRPVKRQTVL